MIVEASEMVGVELFSNDSREVFRSIVGNLSCTGLDSGSGCVVSSVQVGGSVEGTVSVMPAVQMTGLIGQVFGRKESAFVKRRGRTYTTFSDLREAEPWFENGVNVRHGW